jgi:hypothetical protein
VVVPQPTLTLVMPTAGLTAREIELTTATTIVTIVIMIAVKDVTAEAIVVAIVKVIVRIRD